MKKAIVVSILCVAISGFAYAEEQDAKLADQESKQVDQETNLTDKKTKPVKPIKLKRKCIKQNPLVEGQTDQELLQIYQQVCDKSNASQVNDLLAQAAKRMYELKQPMKALTLANQLNEKNVQGALLTDVTFLASVEMANNALQQMRSQEVRYLSKDLTYPPAKELSENIRMAMPASVIAAKKVVEEAPKKEVRSTSTANRRTVSQARTRTAPPRNTATQTTAPANRPTTTTTPSAVRPTGTNPFASLKK
ncbi:hypothetical protein [Acinetobacter suaedae]|uniref:hypothetical protein n=1 Tax=Acinetobacter suaedae TaxID=2609668 RepID=UPI00389938A4